MEALLRRKQGQASRGFHDGDPLRSSCGGVGVWDSRGGGPTEGRQKSIFQRGCMKGKNHSKISALQVNTKLNIKKIKVSALNLIVV